jgi:hypothetical protein
MKGRPMLPAVPETIDSQKYRASGKCPPHVILLWLVAMIPASLVTGIILYLLFIFELRLFRNLKMLWLFYSGVVVAEIAVLVVTFVGTALLLSMIITMIVSRGKCRNRRIAWLMGVAFSSLSLATVFVAESYLITGRIALELDIDKVVAMVIFAAIAGYFPASEAQAPFCEDCELWYIAKKAYFSVDLAQPLIDAILYDSADSRTAWLYKLDLMSPFAIKSPSDYPHLAVKIGYCKNCESSDYNFEATAVWEETTKFDNLSKEKTIVQRERLFSTLVPPTVGKRLVARLVPVEPLASEVSKTPNVSETNVSTDIVGWARIGVATVLVLVLIIRVLSPVVHERQIDAVAMGLCNGTMPALSNVGTSETQAARLWVPPLGKKSTVNLTLPDDIMATNIEQLRYLVCLDEQMVEVRRCAERVGRRVHIFYLQRRNWTLSLWDTNTANEIASRTFPGGNAPRSCVWSPDKYDYIGDAPSEEEVLQWLLESLQEYGWTRD